MASIKLDLPALWLPMTTIRGKSRCVCALHSIICISLVACELLEGYPAPGLPLSLVGTVESNGLQELYSPYGSQLLNES